MQAISSLIVPAPKWNKENVSPGGIDVDIIIVDHKAFHDDYNYHYFQVKVMKMKVFWIMLLIKMIFLCS